MASAVRCEISAVRKEHHSGVGSELTIKEAAFAKGLADGRSMEGAYRNAYNASKMRKEWTLREANKLMNKDRVMKRVSNLLSEQEPPEATMIKRYVLQGLRREADDRKNSATVRVRALELIGRMTEVGLYGPPASAVPRASTSAELEAQLMTLLSGLAERASLVPAKPLIQQQKQLMAH